MMGNYYNMMNGFGSGMWFLGSLVYLLIVVVLILAAIALGKYINKK